MGRSSGKDVCRVAPLSCSLHVYNGVDDVACRSPESRNVSQILRRRTLTSPSDMDRNSFGDLTERASFVRDYSPPSQKKDRFSLCKTLKSIICGQLVSVLMCGTAYCLQDIKSRPKEPSGNISGLSAALIFPTYVTMFVIFIPFLACRGGENSLLNVVRGRGFKYFVVAAIDVEANYLIIHAYKYTTLPSVQMLDCFSIPIVLALSWLFLKVRYKIVHILGVGLCLIGVGSMVWSDVLEYNDTTPQNRLFGDMLCLSAGALYGVSNVLQEFTVKAFSGSVEFLAMIGLFASAISGIQMAILEIDAVQTVLSLAPPQQLSVLGFCVFQTLIYLLIAVVISNSSATALNLSTLSADGLSLLGYYYILNKTFGLHYLFVVSLSLVLLGVVLFHCKPTPLGCLVNMNMANHLHSRLSVAVHIDSDEEALANGRPAFGPASGGPCSRADYDLLR